MSRIREVIKNKNRVEKLHRARRRDEIASLKDSAAFKARLYDELRYLDIILESEEVDAVVLKIPEVYLAKFGAAIYSEDLAEYDIQQVPGEHNKFYVKRKFLTF